MQIKLLTTLQHVTGFSEGDRWSPVLHCDKGLSARRRIAGSSASAGGTHPHFTFGVGGVPCNTDSSCRRGPGSLTRRGVILVKLLGAERARQFTLNEPSRAATTHI